MQLYLGDQTSPFSAEQLGLLKLLGADVTCHAGPAKASASHVVLALESAGGSGIDGMIAPYTLYIHNTKKILPENILVRCAYVEHTTACGA